MAGVDPGFDPRAVGVDVAHVHVVVANHRARAGGSCNDDLVGPDRDAILDQHFGRSGREADGVSAAAGLRPGRIVNVELAELDAERAVYCESLAVPVRAFDVSGPRQRRPIEAKIAASPPVSVKSSTPAFVTCGRA